MSGDDKGLAEFERLKANYDENPTLENYLLIRSTFPGAQPSPARFGGFDPFQSIREELEQHGITPSPFLGALDGVEEDIDAVTLTIIKRLSERRALEKSGQTHIQSLKNGIPDTLINYLIVTLLEACVEHDSLLPASLLILIREQLGGPNPARHKQYLIDEKKKQAAWIAAQLTPGSEKASVREIARILSVEPSTVSRWFADGELMKLANEIRENFKKPPL